MAGHKKANTHYQIDSSLTDPVEHQSKRGALINKVLTIGVLLLLLFSGFLFWQKQKLNQTITETKTAIEQKKKAIDQQLKNLGLNDVKFLKSGQEILDQAKKKRILWSGIYRKIEQLETEGSVEFESISVGSSQLVSLEGRAQSPQILAQFIKTLSNKETIKNVFLSQYGVSEQENNKTSTKFSLTFDFKTNPEDSKK